MGFKTFLVIFSNLFFVLNIFGQKLELSRIYPDTGLCTDFRSTVNLPSSLCLNYVQAQIYCDSLVENGKSDWYLPSFDELTYATSGGCIIPDHRSTDWIWTRTNSMAEITRKEILRMKYPSNITNTEVTVIGTTEPSYDSRPSSNYNRYSVRCVRIK